MILSGSENLIKSIHEKNERNEILITRLENILKTPEYKKLRNLLWVKK